jgi:hypothetical protein
MIDGAGVRVQCTNGAEHHHAAALHHELAADHERQASIQEATCNSVATMQEALLAEQHGQRILFHSDEAANFSPADVTPTAGL